MRGLIRQLEAGVDDPLPATRALLEHAALAEDDRWTAAPALDVAAEVLSLHHPLRRRADVFGRWRVALLPELLRFFETDRPCPLQGAGARLSDDARIRDHACGLIARVGLPAAPALAAGLERHGGPWWGHALSAVLATLEADEAEALFSLDPTDLHWPACPRNRSARRRFTEALASVAGAGAPAEAGLSRLHRRISAGRSVERACRAGRRGDAAAVEALAAACSERMAARRRVGEAAPELRRLLEQLASLAPELSALGTSALIEGGVERRRALDARDPEMDAAGACPAWLERHAALEAEVDALIRGVVAGAPLAGLRALVRQGEGAVWVLAERVRRAEQTRVALGSGDGVA